MTVILLMALLIVFQGPILNPSDPLAEAASGNGVRLLQTWTGPKVDLHGGLSYDGRWVSYVDWQADPGPQLALHDLTNGTDRLLTRNSFRETPGFPVYSLISPDGKRIAYTWRNDDRFHELRLIGAEGESETSRPQTIYRNPETPTVRPQAWFTDGKHILAQLGNKDHTNQIAVISVEDGSMQVIKSLEWRWPNNMGLSPDGRLIVYDFQPDQGSRQRDVYVLAADGSSEVALIEHRADEAWAEWSADGSHVLFTSDRTGSTSLWVLPVQEGRAAGQPRLVKRDLGPVTMLTSGLSGKGELYFGTNTSVSDLYLATVDLENNATISGARKARVGFEGSNYEPAWAPGGSRLAYVSRRRPQGRTSESYVLVIHSVENGMERTLNLDIEIGRGRPRWSPEGTSILMTGTDTRGGAGLYRIDADSGRSRLLLRSPTDAYLADPGWSAGGESVVYREHLGVPGGFRIVTTPLNGGRADTLYSQHRAEPGSKRLAISHNGRWLAFTENEGDSAIIKLLPAEGGQARDLTRVTGGAMTLTGPFEFTPDDRHLLYGNQIHANRSMGGDNGSRVELWRVSLDGVLTRLDLNLGALREISLHPDGKRVAFTVGKSRAELWTIENFLPTKTAAK